MRMVRAGKEHWETKHGVKREGRGRKPRKLLPWAPIRSDRRGAFENEKKKRRGHPRHECSSGVQARSAKDHRTSNMDVDMACGGCRRTPVAGRTGVGVVPPCPQPRVAPSHPRGNGSERPESTCGKGRFEKGGIHWRWWEHPWWWC